MDVANQAVRYNILIQVVKKPFFFFLKSLLQIRMSVFFGGQMRAIVHVGSEVGNDKKGGGMKKTVLGLSVVVVMVLLGAVVWGPISKAAPPPASRGIVPAPQSGVRNCTDVTRCMSSMYYVVTRQVSGDCRPNGQTFQGFPSYDCGERSNSPLFANEIKCNRVNDARLVTTGLAPGSITQNGQPVFCEWHVVPNAPTPPDTCKWEQKLLCMNTSAYLP